VTEDDVESVKTLQSTEITAAAADIQGMYVGRLRLLQKMLEIISVD